MSTTNATNPAGNSPRSYHQKLSQATAVFSDEFQFPGHGIAPEVPSYIEADRLVMAARPGMLRKLLPLRIDNSGVFCGGTYAFTTLAEAAAYGDWCANEFKLDGETLFLDRPEFLEPRSQVWSVAGIEDFGHVNQQKVMRVERWHALKPPSLAEFTAAWWPKIRSAAVESGATSVWLLLGADPIHTQIGLVTAFDADISSADQGASSAEIQRIESLASLGQGFEAEYAATKVFDRTSWIYMIWHPVADGDDSPAAAEWPVSPPLFGLPI
jgi:hypothetical protein